MTGIRVYVGELIAPRRRPERAIRDRCHVARMIDAN
jgi:hypothetical protein